MSTKHKRALICGISGQDGAFLADFLLRQGYQVFGTSRDAQVSSFANLVTLGIRSRVSLASMVLTDFRSVLQVLAKSEPDEIYNLAGQSSVGLSFEQPVETLESIATGTLNLLEAVRFLARPIRIYSAGSSECFGDTNGRPADELTPFRPRSPYAVAKATAYWQVANYREAYGLFACTGILFNHESSLRPERFVTRKIIAAASRIAQGSKEKLRLGNLAVQRDWGWAPEYVEAMWQMLQTKEAADYVVATGEANRLEDFCAAAFAEKGLNWQDHVEIDRHLFRPTEIMYGCGNPEKAKNDLGWAARAKMRDVVRKMLAVEQQLPDSKPETGQSGP
ncbi:MAG TPA: GDP-mannose 4,6-dehydratase [Desulfobulbaceae bacterium]|nr:GDP-mannose 4,6-dehydratase [Desulfobulbaceae bacterium]